MIQVGANTAAGVQVARNWSLLSCSAGSARDWQGSEA